MKSISSIKNLSKMGLGRPAAAQFISPSGAFRRRLRRWCAFLFSALLVSVPGVSQATHPDNLANSPLFISSTVQPNIFYMLDDSGSMDWSLMTPENDGIVYLGGCAYFYTHPTPGISGTATAPAKNDYYWIVATEEHLASVGVAAPQGGVWRAWNKDYNGLYYDPAVTYTPWKGKDVNGSVYTNANPTAAPYNPYRPADGTINLTATTSYDTDYCPTGWSGTVTNFYPARYYTWTDGNSNGAVDASDGHTLVEIKSSTPTYSKVSTRTDCAGATCTYAEEIQNFANWFSYYRKRDLTVKRAVSELVKNSQDRVGLATIWNNNSVGTPIANVDDISTPVNATAVTDKNTLLTSLSKVRPSGSTPLRTGLNYVGKYYEGISQTALFGSAPNHTGTVSPLSPVLDAASGGECEQNFTILMTDGFWNDSFSGLGNVDADGNSPNSAGNTIFDGGAYADTYSNTLADVAMNYYERDLWSSLANKVPVITGVDDAGHQHMVTFGVAFGVNGTLSADPPDKTSPFTWPNPTAGDPQKIDDLRHAAFNGRGKFLSAKSPSTMIKALNDALASIASRTGSAASVAVNTRVLNTSTRLYQARFTSGEWSGELRAIPVDPSTGAVGLEIWNAKDQLITQSAASGWNTNRNILGWNGSAGTAFTWTALNATQQNALDTNPATGLTDGRGSARLDYLRGDPSNEGVNYNFRVRKNGFKLGDIANSAPIFVGAPKFLPDLETTPHSSYRTLKASRRKMIYAGANDGMLHGFDEATGQEKIAYVPNVVFSNLNLLTDPGYTHRYYVDGQLTDGDAFFGSAWHTMLVGSFGHGGKGYFALDVSDPDGTDTPGLAFSQANAANIVKWEFADATTPNDMGYSYGKATIAKMHDGSWAAIFGNGYNSVNESPVLYIVNVADGSIIKKIIFDSTMGTANGLSTPMVVDKDGDFIADYIFAGDLKGNLWKVDVTGNSSATWDSFYKTGSTPKPLFKAVDGSNVVQPITERPEVGEHPDELGGFMVYFGTGKYIENSDKTPQASPVHTFYGVWDKNPNSGTLPGSQAAAVSRSDLLAQTLGTATVGSQTVRSVTNNAIVWRPGTAPDYLGWRVDLNITGEMSVSNPILVGGGLPRLIFPTLIPETAASCGFGGTSSLITLNPRNGGQFSEAIFDLNGDGVFDSNDLIGGTTPPAGINPGIGIIPEPVIIRDPANQRLILGYPGSQGSVGTSSQRDPKSSGRQGWRQLK